MPSSILQYNLKYKGISKVIFTDDFQPSLMDHIVVDNKSIYNCDIHEVVEWRFPIPYSSPQYVVVSEVLIGFINPPYICYTAL